MNGYSKAMKYFRLSADENCRDCLPDPVRVVQYLKAVAGQGEIHEAFNYGLCMFDGNDTKSDPVEAGPEKSTISMPMPILTIAGPKVAAFSAIISPWSKASNRRLTRIIRLDNSIMVQAIPGAKVFQ
jgi:hypothetical protein